MIIPQIRLYVTAMTDLQSDGQLLNVAWLVDKVYPAIDEDPEYPPATDLHNSFLIETGTSIFKTELGHLTGENAGTYQSTRG